MMMNHPMSPDTCKEHSGVETCIRSLSELIRGRLNIFMWLIGLLVSIFIVFLGIMWSNLGNKQEAMATQIKSVNDTLIHYTTKLDEHVRQERLNK
jgi:TRAP-type C4-dicarboxylate transport system permease small subunit